MFRLLRGALERQALSPGSQPPRRGLCRVEDHLVLVDIVEIGVPTAMLVEDGDAPSAMISRPEVLFGR
jgi:hypothetical protein